MSLLPTIPARSPRLLLLPVVLALLTAGAYFAVFSVRVRQPGGAIAFAVLGTADTPGNHGYDGQYYYRLAVAPLGGRHGLDRPAYRYQRIGYPLLARLLALGDTARIAATLVLVNIAAISLSTFCLALLLRRHGLSPLYAIPYALYIGQVACFWRDLAEPLAYALIAVALLFWRERPLWPVCLLLLAAALAKESALLFVAAALGQQLLRARWRAALPLLVLVVIPYALWQGTLWLIFGQTGLGGTDHPALLPLAGLSGVRTTRQLLYTVPAVILPALLCLLLLGYGLWRQWQEQRHGADRAASALAAGYLALTEFSSLALLLNLILVIWLPARSYADLWASTRNAQGMVLAALSYPALAGTRLRYPLALLWLCCAPLLWL